SGIVLTGGAAKIKGALELAEKVFQMPVRLGAPQNVSGMIEVLNNSVYATSVGLLLSGYQQQQDAQPEIRIKGNVKTLWGRMKSWFQGNF
ncbi:MAG: cell division protein FtsA, partial [Gammaproteobacteria bacterium]|nr:cell division protein FtsA [Gammaproteobacteria bacterium]